MVWNLSTRIKPAIHKSINTLNCAVLALSNSRAAFLRAQINTLCAFPSVLTTMGSLGQASSKTATCRLRELLANQDEIIVAPGVYDGISARIALSLGFDALYMVSSIGSDVNV